MVENGRVREAAGPGVCDRAGEDIGCVRIVENAAVRAHAEKHRPSLTLPPPGGDAFCPWNRHESGSGTEPLEDVVFAGLYMNLLHNDIPPGT